MGHPVSPMAWLALLFGHRQAGDRHWLAPKGLPALLDLEIAAKRARSAGESMSDAAGGPALTGVATAPGSRIAASPDDMYRNSTPPTSLEPPITTASAAVAVGCRTTKTQCPVSP